MLLLLLLLLLILLWEYKHSHDLSHNDKVTSKMYTQHFRPSLICKAETGADKHNTVMGEMILVRIVGCLSVQLKY